jgi:hypothetical protein
MKAKRISTLILALVLLAAGTSRAQESVSSLAVSPQGSTDTINFQGRLTDASGNPLTGAYNMRFSIYDAASAGAAVWGPETQNGVNVTNGLFSVLLGSSVPITPAVFDGADRWLQIEVWNGTAWEALNPRLPFSSAAYALSATGIKPGTTVRGSNIGGVLVVQHTPSGGGELAAQNVTPASLFGGAVYGETSSTQSGDYGVFGLATATSGTPYGVWGETRSTWPLATGVYGLANATSGATNGVRGQTVSTTDGATGVYGGAFATSGRTNGVFGATESTTDGATGVVGRAFATSGATYGVRGQTWSTTDAATGVYGEAFATSGATYGVWGKTESTTSDATGVFGLASATSGDTYGVFGETRSSTNKTAGVQGTAVATSGETYGVWGETRSTWSTATGVYGLANATSGTIYGVKGETKSTSGYTTGVFGRALATSGQTYGVWGQTNSTTNDASGVFGRASATGGATYGVWGETMSTTAAAAGVMGRANDEAAAGGRFESDSGPGLYVKSESGNVIVGYNAGGQVFRVDNSGNVYARSYSSPAADFAEMLPGLPGLEPGDVLAIGPDGLVTRAGADNALAVIGVYSSDPAFLGGQSPAAGGDVPVAIMGVVPVKITAANGPIRANDLLTVSATRPGYAARAVPLFTLANGEAVYAGGTIVGRALQGLAAGEGVIRVLLQ